MAKQLKILVVDDTEANLILVSKFIHTLGHVTIIARNGQEAIDQFQAETPDMVLMDVMMPVMDGYESATRIRALCGDKWIPLIFLSAKVQDQDQIKGLEAGGDDYLTKPVNLTILSAKIKAMQRIAEMQRLIVENAGQLAQYREDNEREQMLAKHLLDRIIRTGKIDSKLLRWCILPATNFSGDVIASATTPGDTLHVILADGTGHGLPAALNVMPVIEVFYGMAEKGFSIASIARELNKRIREIMPTERFVAATLISIDLAQQTVNIWNGGSPAAFFIDYQGKLLREWKSSHPPLGILPDEEFDPKPETFHWQEAGQLFAYSDGLMEAENGAGDRFGQERILLTLANALPEDRFQRLADSVEQFLGGRPGADDISLLALECTTGQAEAHPAEQTGAADLSFRHSPSSWKLCIKLGAAELKSFDVLPLLMSWLSQLHLDQKQCREMFIIVGELFNNALDHGVLRLDSTLKSLPDGFDQYLKLREERLAALQQGTIEIELERLARDGDEYLLLLIEDSGEGFDHQQATGKPAQAATENITPSGRGILLVSSLCTGMQYSDKGNKVEVLYRLPG